MVDASNRRTLILVLLVVGALVALTLLVIVVGRDPVIVELRPAVADPGDEVAVVGRFFGDSVQSVVVAGRAVPTSNVRSWTNDEIRFVVPRTVSSGLLYVRTERGNSDGALLQIRASIPRTSFTGEGPGAPVIEGVDVTEVQVGGLITLRGVNFGRTRRSSRVLFPMEGRSACETCGLEISYADWDDTGITVRVPSGATSGFLSVVTPWGASNPIRVIVTRPAGAIVAEAPAEIGLRYGARIDEVRAVGAENTDARTGRQDIVLRLPSVTKSVAQRSIRYLDDGPQSLRFEDVADGFDREVVRTLLVDRYALRPEIDPARVSAAYESETGFFEYYTRALPAVPVDDPAVQEIAQRLRSGRASPYRIAEAAYAFTLDTLVFALGRADRSALAGLASGYGDDFTYATLFVALVRAARVPARAMGGVVVTEDGHAYPHFWAEFFVTGIGWIPVDPALGDGAFPAGFPVPDDPREFYFGSLDNRRVVFGTEQDATEQTFTDGVRVEPADPYTLQLAYAEGGSLVDSFRLDWYRPRLIGLYPSN